MSERRQLWAAKRRDHAYFVRLQALMNLRDYAKAMGKYTSRYGLGKQQAWKLQATTTLAEVLGEFHPLTGQIDEIWNYKLPDNVFTQAAWEQQSWRESYGVMQTAITGYVFMNTKVQDSSLANVLDADLMARVEHVLRVEDWTAVASLAATFVEDRFRTWAGLDHTAFGVNLMTKVLHPETGVFPLGVASAEVEG